MDEPFGLTKDPFQLTNEVSINQKDAQKAPLIS